MRPKKTSEQRKPKKKVVEAKANAKAPATLAVPLIEQKISDHRGFSEDTLNYVASGLGAISLNESANDVFTSPKITTTVTQAINKMAAVETGVQAGETREVDEKFSPAIGQAQAMSTPNLVKVRLSACESLQSPIGMATELIHRKGGKRWRRSSLAAAAASAALLNLAPGVNGSTSATPTSRRATIMVWYMYYVA